MNGYYSNTFGANGTAEAEIVEEAPRPEPHPWWTSTDGKFGPHVVREVPASAVCVEPSLAAFHQKIGLSAVFRRVRLGQASTDPNALLAQFYYDLIIPILSAKCQIEINVAKCANFQLQLSQAQTQVSNGIAQLQAGQIAAGTLNLITAVWKLKELYEKIKDELEPEAPPPPPPPYQLPPKPSEGVPWWAWALGGLAVLGTGVGIYAATRR